MSGPKGTTLRPVAAHDRERLRDWRNLPDVSRYMFTDHIISAEEHARWFERMLVDPTVRYWVIEVDGAEVGVACLTSIDPKHRRCSWGFYIAAAEARGRATGRFAGYTLLRHAFEDLGLNRVACEALEWNERALAMYRALGFRDEGRLRQHVLKAGRLCDVVQLSMLAQEWAAQRPAVEADLRGRGFDLPGGASTLAGESQR